MRQLFVVRWTSLASGLLLLGACGGTGSESLFSSSRASTGGGGALPGAGGGGTVAGGGSVSGNAGGVSGAGGVFGAGGLATGSGGASNGGSAPSTGGYGTGGGASPEAGAPPPDAGQTGPEPTPGVVACPGISSGECTIGSGFVLYECCPAASYYQADCYPRTGGGCYSGTAAVQCDDSADCTTGDICCGTVTNDLMGSSCATLCTAGTVQICRSNAECGGRSCLPLSSSSAYNSCQ